MIFKSVFIAVAAISAITYTAASNDSLDCGAQEGKCLVHLYETNEKSLRCYNLSTHTCADNLLCPIETPSRCGDSCYATGPDGYVCHKNNYLCPAFLPDLCGTGCYNKDSDRHECYNDEYLVEY